MLGVKRGVNGTVGVKMWDKKGHKVFLALKVVFRTCKGSFKKYVRSEGEGGGSAEREHLL